MVDAVRRAVDVQRGMAERNATVPPAQRIEFRVGFNVGRPVEVYRVDVVTRVTEGFSHFATSMTALLQGPRVAPIE